jgi:hypothetical protein
VLGRPADAEGLAFWVSNFKSRGETLLAFSNSTEFINSSARRTQIVWLTRSMIRRPPTAEEQAATSIQQLATQFYVSAEYRNRFGAQIDTCSGTVTFDRFDFELPATINVIRTSPTVDCAVSFAIPTLFTATSPATIESRIVNSNRVLLLMFPAGQTSIELTLGRN